MSGKQEQIKDLEKIIRALADVWPADRENVAVAGAQFEEFIDGFDQDVGQLQKLIDVSWNGLKHLYQEDDYFMSVKAATMQAVNAIREYLIHDGDIQVEDFEKACDELDKALSGGSESADELIELEEGQEPTQADSVSDTEDEPDPDEEAKAPQSLDELAFFIMSLDEQDVSEKSLTTLSDIIRSIAEDVDPTVAEPLTEALKTIDGVRAGEGEETENWLSVVSEKTERAIEIESGENWQDTESEEYDLQEEADSEPDTEGLNSGSDTFYIPDDIDIAMVGEFITECTELLEMAESALLDLEESPNDEELINKVFRAFHTIKGTSAFMGLKPISEFTHLLETMLSMVRDGDIEFDTACADISLEAIDIINQMLDEIEVSGAGDLIQKPNNYERLTVVLEKIAGEGLSPDKALSQAGGMAADSSGSGSGESAVETPGGANKNGTADKGGDSSKADSSVRVNVGRLDQLIDMIGELVIAHSVVAQDDHIPDHSELQKKVSHTSKILRELQDTSLTLRMVPLKATFHKMNRLVRDLSRKSEKSVNLLTVGEDTEIDRNMVDIINEPLVHMIRNAIDHGVEKPEERIAAGKSEKANIWLRASQEGGKVVIEIEDDGRGINKEKVLEKAINKGLVGPDEKLTDNEIYNLIFLPGFSSTDEVTDLSGRGVGMDVVQRSIDQLKGKVNIDSEVGEGTKITIELPFTLAITDGMLVRVGGQRFVVPILNIDMAFRAREKDIFTVMGNSEKVSIRGETVPVIRLHKNFDIPEGTQKLVDGTLLVIRNATRKYALLVDEVIGQQQLVGKSINMMTEVDHVSGGAILGDGTVGLILDTAAIMN